MATDSRFFEDLSESERLELTLTRRRVSVHLTAKTAGIPGLKDAPRVADMPAYSEYAPSPVALTNEGAATVYTKTDDLASGRWLRTIVLVYRLGGRILYRHVDDDTVEALIDFRQPSESDHVLLAFGPRPIVSVREHEVEVCQNETCFPTALGHYHTTINRGLLIWDSAERIWRFPSGAK